MNFLATRHLCPHLGRALSVLQCTVEILNATAQATPCGRCPYNPLLDEPPEPAPRRPLLELRAEK